MLGSILNAIKLARILKTSRAYKRWTNKWHASKMKKEGKRLDQMLKNSEASPLLLDERQVNVKSTKANETSNVKREWRQIKNSSTRKPAGAARQRKP